MSIFDHIDQLVEEIYSLAEKNQELDLTKLEDQAILEANLDRIELLERELEKLRTGKGLRLVK